MFITVPALWKQVSYYHNEYSNRANTHSFVFNWFPWFSIIWFFCFPFQYLLTCLVQFRMLFSRHLESKDNSHEEKIRLLKYLLNGIMTTFTTDTLAKAVSKDVLKDVAMFLLTTTHDSKMTTLEECDTIIKTINIIMLRIIQNSDHTSCFWYVFMLITIKDSFI